MSSTDSPLSLVHRGWEHLRLQRPLAAWACWQRALRHAADDPAATEALAVLESAGDLPVSARVAYKFRAPGASRRGRWSAAFAGKDMADLEVAAEAFGGLADEDEGGAAARFNQALCLAWLGENRPAIVALDRAVSLDAATDFEAAVASWRLAEVLRQGAGAEEWADDVSHSLAIAWDDPGEPDATLDRIAPAPRRLPTPIDPATGAPAIAEVRVSEWLDIPMPSPEELTSPAELPRVLATLVAAPGALRLSSPDRALLEEAEDRLATLMADDPREIDRRTTPLPLRLMDAATWTFRMPEGAGEDLRRAAVEFEFEHRWIHRPRLGLGASIDDPAPRSPLQASDLAAAGDAVARAKLAAVVDLREQLAARPRMVALYDGYPFDRLRRRLGLSPNDPATIEEGDVSCMSRGELAALDVSGLTDSALDEAVFSARGLGDESLLTRFEAEASRRGRGT